MHKQTVGYDQSSQVSEWPLSRLFHENTKLTPQRNHAFQEQVADYLQDVEALRTSAEAYKDYSTRPFVELPGDNRRWAGRRLRDVLRSRRTRRGQSMASPLSLEHWGTLLQMSCGLTGEVVHPDVEGLRQGLRAWPSGGGLYPIETYLLPLRGSTPPRAVYNYDPQRRRLWRVADAPDDETLSETVFADGLLEQAAAVIVLTGVFARSQIKYGERGYRFVLLDAGHLGQNLLLSCEDLSLNAIPLGGFDDDRLGRMMELDVSQEAPLYAILISPRKIR